MTEWFGDRPIDSDGRAEPSARPSSLARLIDRAEACLSLLFSGARLAVCGIAALVLWDAVSELRRPSMVPPSLGLAVTLLIAIAEYRLIRTIERSLATDPPSIALDVARRIRRWPVWVRWPAALAYAISAVATFVLTYLIEGNFARTFHWSESTTAVIGFVVAVGVSYSANLALLGAMAAVRLPPRWIRLASKGRLLIDAAVAVVTAILILGR